MKFKANIKKEELLSILYKKVKNIRDDLNLTNVDFEIVDLELEINNNGNICDCSDNIYLIIYTPTRSDKSTIIGPGGWVVGKLREELKELFNGNLIIRVEDYSDKIIMDEKKRSAESIMKKIGLKKGDNILVIVQCKYDLSVLDFLKNHYNVHALSFDIGTIVMPSKNKHTIKKYMVKNNIPHKFVKPFNLEKEDIINLINNNNCPCDIIFNRLNKYIIYEYIEREFKTSNIKYIINNHIPYNYKVIKIVKKVGKINHSSYNNNKYFVNYLKTYPFKKNLQSYLNCPLLIQICKKNKCMKLELIDEVISDVYDGFIEPAKASKKIIKIKNM